jgi:hypothetical protein
VLLTGCDTGPSSPASFPPPHLLDAELSTSLTPRGFPASSVVVAPRGAAEKIVSTTSIRLRFDRFLLPSETFRQSVCVQSDAREVRSLDDCVNGVFVEPSYDPIRRQITLRQSADSSRTHLAPGTTYWVTVFPPPDAESSGIQAFDGTPLDAPTSFRFTTLDPDPEGARVEPVPDPIFCSPDGGKTPGARDHLQNCSTSGCHVNGAGDAQNPLDAPQGLDMSDIASLRATAIGHVAHQTQMGEHAARPETRGLLFGRSMPIIDPGNPGNSYLLYKIIANRSNSTEPDPAEVERLRDAVVVGMPMPPSNAQSTAFLDAAGMDRLSAWIAQGAPTPSCAK